MGDGKINSAFEGGVQHGGSQRVAATIREISGIQIDHILYVDLAGFEGVVNALGGVEMCVPYPMVDPLTALDIPAGCQRLRRQDGARVRSDAATSRATPYPTSRGSAGSSSSSARSFRSCSRPASCCGFPRSSSRCCIRSWSTPDSVTRPSSPTSPGS